jgi:hypothetical protein
MTRSETALIAHGACGARGVLRLGVSGGAISALAVPP